MEADGATECVTDAGTAELKESKSFYDQDSLDTLLEHLQEAELVGSGALTPEHEVTETVARKWNATKLKRYRKRGREIREIIDDARQVGGYRLEVRAG